MKKLILCSLITIIGATFLPAQTVKVHTIGDSTMADYVENTTRTRGWGEMLQEFFSSEVQVINYARGGRSSRSFCEEGLWDKVKKNMSPGDYVFIQFAHNDEKEGGKDGADFRGTAPWTTYKSFLEKYVDETRQLGATPIFITPVVRRYFDENGKITPKGCHDLGTMDDDSTLNYVRVMKHVARQKKASIVDMTALTKSFVEHWGPDATVRKVYVPTDGTHTQATGAACYARIAAAELKRMGILDSYIDTEVPLIVNPTSLDFGTVYVGDEATLCFDIVGLNLLQGAGTLSLHAPEKMSFSFDLQSAPQREIDIPYSNGKLWNQTLFLHFIPTVAATINSTLIVSNGNQVRRIPVKAISKEISQRTEVTLTHIENLMKGMKKNGNAYTIESGLWPMDIDESGNRYVEFIVRNNDKTLLLKQISFTLKGNPCYRIAYARGKDFYPRIDIAESQKGKLASDKLVLPINATINPNDRLHIRFFPWCTEGGKMDFEISDWQIMGIEIE